MKKILTIGILMGMAFLNEKEAIASTGAAYTGYVIEKSNIYMIEKGPRIAIDRTTKLEIALKNHR